jgi:hypothetical protein
MVVNDLKKWLLSNYKSFILPRIENIPPVISEPPQEPHQAPTANVEPPML